ncbi:MAG: 16S rRNA (cytidine(1402)-2'-O)-methyltransferase [Alphaproteobacteria bacterium]|nr:16S rRNA (cytidine(1402)-2'-O)-methyltransferase [Alphaproteobacteria bacterium]
MGLSIVATPIGNAGDITLRALDALKRVAAVVCEDTRVTMKLFGIHGISTRLVAYHDHNAEEMRPKLVARLMAGEALALVSDAGTPLVSDPGYKLVRECLDRGIAVTALPGPSAVIDALVLSGLPSDRFFFAGFLPPRAAARRAAIAELAGVPGSLVFYEAPQRLAECLGDLGDVLGDRPAAVARELTKRYEELRRDRLAALAAHYAASGAPKGEVVIVVGPPDRPAEATAAELRLDQMLGEAMARSSLRDAVDEVAAASGLPRRLVYRRALALGRAQPR